MSDSQPVEVSGKHAKCVELLAEGLSTTEIADALGTTSRTIRRWISRPDVSEALSHELREATAGAIRSLRAHARHAVSALVRVLDDPDAAPTAKVSAAKCILDAVWKCDELDRLAEIESRLDQIEAQQGIRRAWN